MDADERIQDAMRAVEAKNTVGCGGSGVTADEEVARQQTRAMGVSTGRRVG